VKVTRDDAWFFGVRAIGVSNQTPKQLEVWADGGYQNSIFNHGVACRFPS
jgi:hypothetical protein